MAPGRVWRVWWQGVGAGDGCRDKGLAVVRSGQSGGLVYVAGTFEDIVGPWPVPPLLEPAGDRPVILEGAVEAHPYSHFYQPVVNSFLSMVPLSPVSAQLAVSFFQVLLVEGSLPQAVDIGFDPDVVEVP